MIGGVITFKYTFSAPPGTVFGDVNNDGVTDDDVTGDGVVNADDVTSQQLAVAYDWDGSGEVDYHDLDHLVHTILDSEYGDFNLDGTVNIQDFGILSQHYNGPGGYAEGDITGDGWVDGDDFAILQANYGWHR